MGKDRTNSHDNVITSVFKREHLIWKIYSETKEAILLKIKDTNNGCNINFYLAKQ